MLRVKVFVGFVAAMLLVPPSAALAQDDGAAARSTDMSSQRRRVERRAPTRIEVYPLRGPLRRECVAVYEERYVPAWRQTVIYPGQRCWWTRG